MCSNVQPGQDADGIEDTHTVFCGVTICDEITVKDWDVGLCLAYYNPFGSISMNVMLERVITMQDIWVLEKIPSTRI